MLKVSHLSHCFNGGQTVLRDISLSVSEGEIVALLGPSGCGKSTLLKLIAGLLPLQGGTCELKENNKPAFVFQESSLMPWATVTDNVALPMKLLGSVCPKTIQSSLENLDIESLANRYPSELSGGQKMRVSIARALAASPKLLLLDEPFAALDEILRFKMNELILSLQEKLNIGTLFVTHSIYEAAYLADRVLVMHDGKISGSVNPGLDRNLQAADQRSSAAFLIAATQISNLLAGEG